jgi:hypothetical protein
MHHARHKSQKVPPNGCQKNEKTEKEKIKLKNKQKKQNKLTVVC